MFLRSLSLDSETTCIVGECPADISKTTIGEVSTNSCERCRRRKIKCDRRHPCSRCRKAGTECVRGGNGEKQRPVPKSYIQALEGQIASLELFIRKLALADNNQRSDMLKSYQPNTAAILSDNEDTATHDSSSPSDDGFNIGRARAGQLRKRTKSNSTHFYGATSLFQIHLAGETTVPLGSSTGNLTSDAPEIEFPPIQDSPSELNGSCQLPTCFLYAPHDDVSQRLMSAFFRQQYQYNMCVYREYFLRDYDIGVGQYYSDMLLYAICSMGALATGNPVDISLSNIFSTQAQTLLYLALESPDLTTLQTLILLGQREIGHGRASKGWLFCGMAFRLAHEMGLHLDPNNWSGASEASESDVEREILRRVYWAAFIVDKQLSLYFGRPPALYIHESDVKNTVRLPHPQGWETLWDTYILKGTSFTDFEDGIALVGSFIYQAELSKIQHNIITELFENRRGKVDHTTTTATVHQLHVSLTKWLTSLPGKLHWNQWTVGEVPACVLHLHMRFHTAMIILHRPPRHLFSSLDTAQSEDVEICYESMQAIFRLMRSYARYYEYTSLPLDFVHTLSTAAGTILMKQSLEGTEGRQTEATRSLTLILEAMDSIKHVWPCVLEIKEVIVRASENRKFRSPSTDLMMDLDFILGPSRANAPE